MILLGKGIPLEKQLWFQDSYTQLATLIVNVHNIIWYFATFIAVFVAWILTLAVIDGYMDCNYFSSVAWNKGKDAKIVDWSALDVNFTQPKGVLHLLFF